MKHLFKIGIILLTISFNSEAKTTFKEAQNIFSHLQNASGQHVTLKLRNVPWINAYTTKYNIQITQGLLDFTDYAGVALVLGHELGHWIYKDPRQQHNQRYLFEERADVIGNHLCKKINYKHCLNFMYKMKKVYGDGDGSDGAHPPWSKRIKHVKQTRVIMK